MSNLRVNRITVPNLSVSRLCLLVQQELCLTEVSSDLYSVLDFVPDEVGKTFDVMVSFSDYEIRPPTRNDFPEGYRGNIPAFMTWLTEERPHGRYSSYPEDDQQLPYGYVPIFCIDEYERSLELSHVQDLGLGGCCFVAFREVE